MWLLLLVLFSTIFSDTPLANPLDTENVEGDLTENDGYRCGRRVFTRKFLQHEADLINHLILSNLATTPDSLSPQVYTGDLDFGADGITPYLWQLPPIDTALSTESHSQHLESYFAILANVDGQRFHVIGAMMQLYGINSKCTYETHLDEFSNYDIAAGYRCPIQVFSFEVVDKFIGVPFGREGGKHKMIDAQFHYRFNGKSLFDESEVLLMRPVSSTGRIHALARSFIIMDKNFQLLGLVYKKDDYYVRCRLTAHQQIEPRFIGPALQQSPERVDLESLDVFQCESAFILASEILEIAKIAPSAFYGAIKGSHATFPRNIFRSYMGGTESLYEWPARRKFNNRHYRVPSGKMKIYLIIDDFSNVYKLIVKPDLNRSEDCTRKLVDKRRYLTHRKDT